MMRDQLRHLMATLSVFLVSIGLMGATPKKSEGGFFVAGACVVGGVVVVSVAAYCIYDYLTTPGKCQTPPACVVLPGGGGCNPNGAACGVGCSCVPTANANGCNCQ